MTEATLPHGGDLAAARARYGEPPEGWLDLSTGISPFSYPVPELGGEAWQRLPDREAETALIASARRAYGASPDAAVVLAPGTQALIQQLPYLRPQGRVGVISPTYGEHAHCWRQAGHEVSEVALGEITGDEDVIVLVNPNNPDGRYVDARELAALAEAQSRRDGWLVVDEAFQDVFSDLAMAAEAGRGDLPGLVVLRSFGKFFGLAGVRLGFALTSPGIAAALAARLGPWSVAGPALEIGREALSDSEWITTQRLRLAAAASGLRTVLREHGLTAIGGTDLYQLVETPDPDLHTELAERGIWTRAFPDHPTWLRFGLPPDDQTLARLDAALRDALERRSVA